MFKRLMQRFMLLEGEGATDAPAGGAAAAAPAAAAPSASSAPAAAPAEDLNPPASLLNDAPADKPADKPADDAKPADQAKPEEPIQYEDFKLPEGVELNAEKLDAFKKLGQDAGLSQDVAQKLVDLYTAEVKEIAEAPYRAWKDLQTTWRNEVINDPVIGGANLEKNLATVKSGFKALLGEDSAKFFDALNVTGAGNNPEIVRGLLKAAAPHAPATPVTGSPGKLNSKSPGATLYPQMAGLGNGHEG